MWAECSDDWGDSFHMDFHVELLQGQKFHVQLLQGQKCSQECFAPAHHVQAAWPDDG